MYRRSDTSSTFWEAGGVVVKSTDTSVEMEDRYTGGTNYGRWAGGILRFWITGIGDTASGTAQGADGKIWRVSLERVK